MYVQNAIVEVLACISPCSDAVESERSSETKEGSSGDKKTADSPIANGVIAGSVFSAEGDPVSEAIVVAVRIERVAGKISIAEVAQASSDDQGSFRLYGLAPGRYALKVSSGGQAEGTETSSSKMIYPLGSEQEIKSALEVTSGSVVDGLNLTLPLERFVQSSPRSASNNEVAVGGTVRSWVNDDPVVNAKVELRETSSEQHITLYTRTDRAGKFNFGRVPPAVYRVVVTKPGFLTSLSDDVQGPRYQRTIDVTSGHAANDVALRLMPEGVIAGKIFVNGLPVTNAVVSISRFVLTNGERKLNVVRRTYSNDLGDYRLFDLPPGRYYLTAMHFENEAPDSRKKKDEAEGEVVSTFYPNTPIFSDASPIDLRSGTTLSSTNIDLYRARKWSVSGKVVLAGSGGFETAPSVSLMPFESALEFVSTQNTAEINPKTGDFHLDNIMTGRYVLTVGTQIAGVQYSAAAPINVTEANVEGIVVNLTPTARVYGTVIVEKPGDCSLSELSIHARSRGMSGTAQTIQAAVDENSSFIFANLRPDRFRIELQDVSDHCYLKSMSLGTTDVSSDDVPLGQVDLPLVLTLSPKAGKIDGEVVDGSHQLVRSATIALLSEAPILQQAGEHSLKVRTDESGRFVFYGLAPGEYKLFAWDTTQQQVGDLESLKLSDGSPLNVSVQENGENHVQLQLSTPEAR